MDSDWLRLLVCTGAAVQAEVGEEEVAPGTTIARPIARPTEKWAWQQRLLLACLLEAVPGRKLMT